MKYKHFFVRLTHYSSAKSHPTFRLPCPISNLTSAFYGCQNERHPGRKPWNQTTRLMPDQPPSSFKCPDKRQLNVTCIGFQAKTKSVGQNLFNLFDNSITLLSVGIEWSEQRKAGRVEARSEIRLLKAISLRICCRLFPHNKHHWNESEHSVLSVIQIQWECKGIVIN